MDWNGLPNLSYWISRSSLVLLEGSGSNITQFQMQPQSVETPIHGLSYHERTEK